MTADDGISRVEALRRRLRGHEPADELEQRYVTRMLALLGHGERALSRDFFEPGHFTASAFVLSPERDALLLILHQKLGLWLQPGGHVEPEDVSLEAAARREADEEVGLGALELAYPGIFDVDIHDIPAYSTQPAHQHFDVRFLFVSPTREVRSSSEAKDARWTRLDDVSLTNTDESFMRAVRRLSARG